jgi:HPr kinase/phosphorylase
MQPSLPQVVHATCVALGDKGLLILGPSGSGKSGLALGLMATGAALVADDRVQLHRADDGLHAAAPPGLPPLIEARGIGLLRAPLCAQVRVCLVVDMGQTETDRLPPARRVTLLGLQLPLVHKVESSHFPAAILHYLAYGREE